MSRMGNDPTDGTPLCDAVAPTPPTCSRPDQTISCSRRLRAQSTTASAAGRGRQPRIRRAFSGFEPADVLLIMGFLWRVGPDKDGEEQGRRLVRIVFDGLRGHDPA
ncbi:hypothetical protein GCM10010464_71960 [Pseudonocardia yunnanensis]